GVLRRVVDDATVHLNAVQPAPDHGGQHEKKDWDERGNAMPREGPNQLTSKGYRNSRRVQAGPSYQTFQGGLPLAHSSSRARRSRIVSIGRQYPSWRKTASCPSRARRSRGSRSRIVSGPM